jgi:aminoglycoside phosphotransferase (APT) family kinase protein
MDRGSWDELAIAACSHANIKPGAIETLATWDQVYCANAVYRIYGQQYLKLFGPAAERQFHIERALLRILEAHPVIPAPRIIAEGERASEPPYLLLSGIPGDTAENVWDELERSQQLALARDFGAITAAIHRLPQEELAAIEQQFGGRSQHTRAWKKQRTAEIEATGAFSVQQRDDLLRFLHEEAPQLLDGQLKVTHYDLAHNHIYLSQESGTWQVTGIIDWAEAMLGPPEWDVAYLWFWTFTRDREAMRESLRTLYADSPPPERFARRCMAALLYTSSMALLWPYFAERGGAVESIAREMTAFYFPVEVFGSPD